MKIGIGLPSTIPNVPGRLVVEWAREAERYGFSSLGTIDRLRYPSYEPLTALAAAAAVTERIELTTAIWLPLLHGNAAAIAKQVASVDALSNGRLTFGLAVGDRPDDFERAGVDFAARGRLLDTQLAELRELWADGTNHASVPAAARREGPPIIIGGAPRGPALRRFLEYGSGWIASGGSAELATVTATVRGAWKDAGREGTPKVVGLAYYGLAPNAREHALDYLGDYYSIYGAPPEALADHSLLTADAIRAEVKAHEDAGADEFILSPVVPDLDEVGALAKVVGLA
jgi:alkanesulfonate monooxygenase SsuD/methylene tetrahydromethanopterin reductase-like flavin-dependent oxidoreductase (luciferase family)